MSDTRTEFAAKEYVKLLKEWQPNDYLSGFRARKIDQAYRIYIWYSGIKHANHPSVFNRVEIYKDRKERAEKKSNFQSDERRKKLMSIHWNNPPAPEKR